MSFKIYSIIILVIALFLISCQEQSPVETTSTSNISDLSLAKKAPQVSPDTEFDGHYIIIANGNTLPAGLSKSVANAKGNLTGKIEKLGLATAYSEDPDFAETLSAMQGITAVIPDIKVDRIKPLEQQFSITADAANPPASGDDDFFFDLQWGHDAVDAPEAWELGHRGAGVRVFILDEGFDMDHPDLEPNINAGLATSFVEGEPDPDYLLPGPFSHGTHTAGTIGAADNGYGTIGIAPEAELVPVKVLSELLGYGYSSWIIQGVLYAAENGADVINMSIGWQRI